MLSLLLERLLTGCYITSSMLTICKNISVDCENGGYRQSDVTEHSKIFFFLFLVQEFKDLKIKIYK